ncbi:MAG: hypothetical protein V3S22_00715 [Candidatus Neomarinimicrobiota bacterium]
MVKIKKLAAALILISGCLTAGTLNKFNVQKLRTNVTRILLDNVNHPVYNLDEPASAYMALIVLSCHDLLDELNRANPGFIKVDFLTADLLRKIDRLGKLRYDLKLTVKAQSNNVFKQFYSLGDF